MSSKPKIFISYRHESDGFRKNIGKLTVWLRQQGLTVISDQDFAAAPPQGWRHWMNQSIEEASVVLVVCTKGYKDNFEGKDTTLGGRGTVWEGAIINSELYETKRFNTKFIPIQPDNEPFESLPKSLRDFHNNLYFPSAKNKIYNAILQYVDLQDGVPLTVLNELEVMNEIQKSNKQEIIEYINTDLDKAFDLLDEIFGKTNGAYNDFSKEYSQPSDNFNIGRFRSRLKRFVKMSL